MIVLDASVLIAHLDGADAHHDEATDLLVSAAEDDLVASPITLAEVLVGPAWSGELHRATAALDLLGVGVVALDADAPTKLALLRAGTGLKLPDCCVILAAETAGAALATFDRGLADAAGKHGISVRGG